jgi:hypothetical protein
MVGSFVNNRVVDNMVKDTDTGKPPAWYGIEKISTNGDTSEVNQVVYFERAAAAPCSKLAVTTQRLSGLIAIAETGCRLQVNRRLAHFEVRFLQLNRRPILLFAAKS